MPSINYLEAEQLVLARFSGRVSSDSFTQYFLEMERHGPFPTGVNLLVIFEPDARLDVTSEHIREMSNREAQFSKDALRVIVAEEDLSFGLSRLYASEAPNASSQYSIVRSIQEASEILGLDPNADIEGRYSA